MSSYTRAAMHSLPPPPHLAYVGAIQSNGGGGGLFNANAASTPPTLSMASGHSSSQWLECIYCQRRIEGLSIKCCECVDFYLCLKCFSMSAEIGEHKKDHNYFIISKLNFPLFDSEKLWTYKEELLLLQFIEQYGFGNWEEIAKHLPSRTAEECLQHYNSYYIYGNLGKYTFNANSRNILMSNGSHAGVKSNLYNETPWYSPTKASATSLPSVSSLSVSLADTVPLPPLDMSSEEQRALGYMPLRDDYERVYKNDAESVLAHVELSSSQMALLSQQSNLYASSTLPKPVTELLDWYCAGESSTDAIRHFNQFEAVLADPCSESMDVLDDMIELELKQSVIKMYSERLGERQCLKHVAREYGLVNNASALINSHALSTVNESKYLTRTVSTDDLARPKHKLHLDEDDTKLGKFAQLMNATEYESLVANIKTERNLRKRLHELKQTQSSKRLCVKLRMNPKRAVRYCSMSSYNIYPKCQTI